jgi:hypothetical protein
MLNTLPVAASARAPRGIVQVNGRTVSGWIDFEVKNSTFFEADTFSVNFSENALPKPQGFTSDVGYEGTDGLGAQFFSNISEDTFVELFAGFPADPNNPQLSELTSLIYGRIDDINYDPALGVLTLTGRDLTGALIDAKVAHNYLNKTAAFVATDVANSHALTPVTAQTKGLVGSLQPSGDYQLLQTTGSDWDLLTQIARRYGFICAVQGKTLFFGPQPPPVLAASARTRIRSRAPIRWVSAVRHPARPQPLVRPRFTPIS